MNSGNNARLTHKFRFHLLLLIFFSIKILFSCLFIWHLHKRGQFLDDLIKREAETEKILKGR
jgi:hypothetical protein